MPLIAKEITSEVIALAEKRKEAKLQKQWSEADKIRLDIERLGYKIVDTENGYKLI
jgi:cysteinyl-tRNA synthetase